MVVGEEGWSGGMGKGDGGVGRVEGKVGREWEGLLVVVLGALEVWIWEGLEGVRDGVGASADEFGGEGVDFVLSKLGLIVKPCTQEYELLTNSSGVERSREGRLAEHFPDVRQVAGLDGQDSASSGEVVFLDDGSSGSEVG